MSDAEFAGAFVSMENKKMLIRNLSCIVFASLLAETVLTGCGHSTGSASAFAPGSAAVHIPGASTQDGAMTISTTSSAPVTVDGITVTYFSPKFVRFPAPAGETPKDPVPGEKLAVQFLSSISSGDLAAAKSDMASDYQARYYEGGAIKEIAHRVKGYGPITDISFYQFAQNGDAVFCYGIAYYNHKKSSRAFLHFQVGEGARTKGTTNTAKNDAEYADGKWCIRAVVDMENNQNM